MAKSAKHTPGPWKHQQLGRGHYILSSSGYVIARVGGNSAAYSKLHGPNADYIVKAVNVYEKQSTLLTRIKKCLGTPSGFRVVERYAGDSGLVDAVKALHKASVEIAAIEKELASC